MSLLPHQHRVVTEMRELDIKLDALHRHLIEHREVDSEEMTLLVQQRAAMSLYRDILDQRIQLFYRRT
jgi:hypothetical protein